MLHHTCTASCAGGPASPMLHSSQQPFSLTSLRMCILQQMQTLSVPRPCSWQRTRPLLRSAGRLSQRLRCGGLLLLPTGSRVMPKRQSTGCWRRSSNYKRCWSGETCRRCLSADAFAQDMVCGAYAACVSGILRARLQACVTSRDACTIRQEQKKALAAVAGPPESRAGRVSKAQCPCDNLRPRQAHASGCKHCDNSVGRCSAARSLCASPRSPALKRFLEPATA